MAGTRKVEYILVTDLDNTAVVLRKINLDIFSKVFPRFLSPKFLEFIRRDLDEKKTTPIPKTYSNFYVCTHRTLLDKYRDMSSFATAVDQQRHFARFYQQSIHDCDSKINSSSATDDEKKKALENKTSWSKFLNAVADCSDVNTDDNFINRIVANLEAETKINCLAVSSPEDSGDACGAGYEKILKPFELAVMGSKSTIMEERLINKFYKFTGWTHYKSPRDITLPYEKTPIKSYNHSSKNDQLISIAKDIIARFGTEKDFVLDFVDDLEVVRANALKIDPNELPANITIRVFKHQAQDQDNVTFEGQVQGKKVPLSMVSSSSSSATALVHQKLFSAEESKPAAIVTTLPTSTSVPTITPPTSAPATSASVPALVPTSSFS